MITLVVPRYNHPAVSEDERIAKAICDPLDPGSEIPGKCGGCGAKGSFANPLMARPHFLTDTGGPRGTLYQVRCSECMERRARRR